MFEDLINFIIFILPCYVANATPVALSKIIPMKNPIDRGKKFIDGRRILGDGKTIEGFISGVIVGTLVGLILSFLGLHKLHVSFILALGAMIGDSLGSFIKRRVGIPRGKPFPIVDQVSFVIISLILANAIVFIPMRFYLYAVIITPPLHLGTNFIAYLLKLKEVPW